ncbi:MAG: hypothetical protein OET79_12985 [Nitrospirota bacterium]|nr:hypothetical protein [Nitrospirota bacterium]
MTVQKWEHRVIRAENLKPGQFMSIPADTDFEIVTVNYDEHFETVEISCKDEFNHRFTFFLTYEESVDITRKVEE